MNIAIIPARGGSKRIPRKNIADFAGEPVISRTIRNAQLTHIFDKIFVSTDDDVIADVAKKSGATILNRPVELSDDFTSTLDVLAFEVTSLLNSQLDDSDLVACIYPVTPLLNFNHLTIAMKLTESDSRGYVFAVTESAAPIERSFHIDTKNYITKTFEGFENNRTQDIEKTYFDAGQFYVGTAAIWSQKKPIFSANSRAYVIPRYEVIDIDTLEDWEFAEELFALRIYQESMLDDKPFK